MPACPPFLQSAHKPGNKKQGRKVEEKAVAARWGTLKRLPSTGRRSLQRERLEYSRPSSEVVVLGILCIKLPMDFYVLVHDWGGAWR